MVISDLDATYRVFGTDPETMRFVSSSRVDAFSMALEISDADENGVEEGSLKVGLAATAMTSSGSGSLISLGTMGQFAGDVPPGLSLDAELDYGAFDLELAFEEGVDVFEVLYTNEGGSLAVGFSEDALSYDVSATDVQARVFATDLPAPIDIAIASTDLGLAIPLAAADAPQDMRARLAYQDITMGDTLWAMLDPQQSIPRDPASIIFDATGQIQLFLDLLTLDPETLQGPPGELRALTVNELQIAAAGAELSGTADLTFAPGQIEPVPEGSAEVEIRGANALLDTLISAGLVPNEEGAFARGALNIFARPGATVDTYESTIEFSADGSVTANGIPLQ